jgi:mono/diheme cytochrome c family protein
VFRHSLYLIIIASLIFAGCEGARSNSSWSTAKPGAEVVPSLAKTSQTHEGGAVAQASGGSGRGVGPVDHVDVAALDGARGTKGAEIFTTKCSACHKLDERYIGPALAGVTKRRQPEWILNMILNPENMVQQDPTAKALLAEYVAPMANQHLTRDEAESVLAHFLQHDAGQASAQAPAGASVPTTSH